jgi:hypothetical protein
VLSLSHETINRKQKETAMMISWHARERMRERGISESIVLLATTRGAKRFGSDGTVECRVRGIKVVLNPTRDQVVTVCRER